MSTKRYFDILGIPPTKDEKVVKRAYRKKAMKYHPDRNPSTAAKDRFILITEAYDNILIALDQAKKTKYTSSSSTNRTTERSSARRRPYQSRTETKNTQGRTEKREEREERVKEAQKRYENMKRKEAQENERYYQNMISGKRWKIFTFIMLSCTLMSFIITLDTLYFPTRTDYTEISKKNLNIVQPGDRENSGTSGVMFSNGQKAWVSLAFIGKEESNYLYLERTLFFKEIKYVKYWRSNQWQYYIPDYGLVSTYPLIPIVFLIPLLTYFIKERTIYFSILYHGTMYIMPAFLLVFLISNDRWAHLLTLGFLG